MEPFGTLRAHIEAEADQSSPMTARGTGSLSDMDQHGTRRAHMLDPQRRPRNCRAESTPARSKAGKAADRGVHKETILP